MLAGRWINIVGSNPEQYKELATSLSRLTGGRCHVTDSSPGLSPTLKFNAKAGLVLIDSMEDHPGQALDILLQCRKSDKKLLNYAFFNAEPNSRLEKLVSPPDIRGIFYQGITNEQIAKGVMAIFNGELWFPRRVITRYLLNQAPGNENFARKEHDILTNREMEILNLLSTGAKNTDIAEKLCLSVHTIKTHIYHIYKKLDVSNRTQAVNWATNNLC